MPDFAFQDQGIEFLAANPRALLGDDPGLGKSRQALVAASRVLGPDARVLVLAPAMILDSGTWTNEIERWAPDLNVTQAAYTRLPDRVMDDNGRKAKVTGRPREEFRQPWDLVIADEAHYLKGRATSWTEALERLEFDRFWALTGTPIPNWAHELFVLCRLMRPKGDKTYSSFWRWAGEWFMVAPTKHSPMAVGELRRDRTWEEFHQENLGGLYLARTREEVLDDLPPLVMQDVECPMTATQKRAYQELKRDYLGFIDTPAGQEEVVAWTPGGLAAKIAKATTGLCSLEPLSYADAAKPATSILSGSGKIAQFAERVGSQTHPSLTVCWFKDTAEALRLLIESMGMRPVVLTGNTSKKGRFEAVQGFQAGRYDVLIGTIATVAEGLTLTRADTVHLVERSYMPSKNEQVIRRVHRIGQDRPVTVYRYLTPGSVDQRMSAILEAKTDQQIRALRQREFAALL